MNIEEIAFKDRKNLVQLNENDLLDIIEFLQNDRKQWINQFSKTHNESIDIQKEKQELKQKYLNAVADYETTMSELQELKKQLEEYKATNEVLSHELTKDKVLQQDCLTTCCGIPIGDIPKLITQQKEFIEYLTSYIDLLSNNPDLIEEAEIDILEEILSKYREIIGGKE